MYDLIIIGGGTAAAAAAIKSVPLGKTCLLINSGLPLGGTCVNVGCIPTKGLLTIADEFYNSRHPGFPDIIQASDSSFDFPAAIKEKDKIVARAREQFRSRLKKLRNVTLLEERAAFTGSNKVEAAGKIYKAEKIIIAVGASTRLIPVPGLDKIHWLNNVSAMQLKKLPASLVVIGGGPLGIEYAQMFAYFGSRVTVLEVMPHILPRYEPEIAAELRRALEDEGITIHCGINITGVKENNGRKTIVYQENNQPREIVSDEVLLGAGIKPNTSGLNLEKAGVKVNKYGYISTNQFLQTDNPDIFAAGDCAGKMALESVASREGSLAVDNAFTVPFRQLDYDCIPSAVFTTPQAASVGLTAQEAERRYGNVLSRSISINEVPRARTYKRTRGIYKMVAHARTRRILGMHIVAPYAAEIIHEVTLAINNRLSVDDIIETVHIFPTFSEGIKQAARTISK